MFGVRGRWMTPEGVTMSNHELQMLKVSENRRFLVKEDGSPFFWLGDTAWELFHKLNREEADLYLRNRAERKFNVIQAVALGELDGIVTGNAYGCKPLKLDENGLYDPTRPDTDGEYSYWDHVDYIVDRAAELGIYIAMLPTWGDKFNKAWGKGPVIFNAENARIYGKWIGERYKDRKNILWVLGGDRILQNRQHFSVVYEMACGIKESGSRHLMTFHPQGEYSSSYHWHEEVWLDFNMIQSGHASQNLANYEKVKADYEMLPVKPVLDGEPRYEDHPIGFNPDNGFFDDFDTRQAAYWAVFSGAFGHTYGHHSIWSMTTEPANYFIMHWKDAILRPGAEQLQHLKALVESRPFLERIPDQELLVSNYPKANYMAATRGSGYAFIYSPCGLKFQVNMGRVSGDKVNAAWYNPRNGEWRVVGAFDNAGTMEFTPPSSGRKDDWVLVLDDSRIKRVEKEG